MTIEFIKYYDEDGNETKNINNVSKVLVKEILTKEELEKRYPEVYKRYFLDNIIIEGN